MRKSIIIILIIIFNLILISPGISYVAISASSVDDYSTCDEDLQGFGIDEDSLIHEEGVNHQVNVLLFAETTNEDGDYYYYLYVHDPNAFAEIEASYYQAVQVGYLTAFTEEVLDDSDAVSRSLRYLNLKYLSSSSSGTVAKYLINDFHPDDMKTFRRYQIRQLMTQKNGERIFINIGDEYCYKTNEDGSVEYQYKKMDYITFENIKLASFLINSNESTFEYLLEGIIGELEFSKYEFYGFSLPEGFEIDNILSMRFNYKKYDYEFNKPGIDIYAPVYQYTPLIGDQGYSEYTWKISNPKYISSVVEDYEVEVDIRSHWFISQKVKWKTISKYSDLEKIDNKSLKSGLQEKFIDCDYIINYAVDDVQRTYGEFAYALGSSMLEYDPFIYSLYDYDKNVSSIYNGGFYNYSHYISKYYAQVEPVFFTFERDGNIYSLDVIVSPKNSSIDSDGVKPDPDIIDTIVDLYNKFVAWIMEIFKVSEIVAHIISVGSIIGGLSILLSLLGKFVSGGLSKIILNIGNIIISILTWPARLLFSDKKDLIMKKGE